VAGNSRTTLTVEILAQGAQAAQELNQTATRFEQFGKKVTGSLAGLAIGATVASGVQQTVSAASDLQNAMFGVNRIFGDSAAEITDWASNTSDSLRVPASEVEQFATLLGVQLKGAGTAMDQLAPSTQRLIERANDTAVALGKDTPMAIEAFSAALKGEYDTLDNFGIKLNANMVQTKALELAQGDAAKAATPALQAQAALSLLYDQTAQFAGAAAEGTDLYSQQQANAEEKASKMASTVGTALLPALGNLWEIVGNAAEVFTPFLTAGAEFLTWITGLPAPILATGAALGVLAVAKNALDFSGVASAFRGFADAMEQRAGLVAATGGNISKIGTAAAEAGARAKILGTSLMGAFGGPWMLAITAVVGGVIALIDAFDKGAPEAHDFAGAIDEVTGKLSAAAIAKGLPDDLVKQLTDLGITTQEWAEAIVGTGSAADDLKAKLGGIREAGTTTGGVLEGTDSAPIERLTDKAQLADDVLSQFGVDAIKAGDQVATFKSKSEGATQATKDQAKAMGAAKITIDQWTAAFRQAAENTELEKRLSATSRAADDAQRAFSLLSDSVSKVDGQTRSLVDTQTDLGAATDNVKGLFDKTGDKAEAWGAAVQVGSDALLDFNTASLATSEAGRSVITTLLAAKDAHVANYAAVYSNIAATGDLAAAQQGARDAAHQSYQALLDQVTAFTGNEQAARDLLAQLGILDGQQISDKDFQIIAEDKDAKDKLTAIINTKLVDKTFNIIAQDLASAGISQVQSIEMQGKTVIVHVDDTEVRRYKPDPITGELHLIPKVIGNKVWTGTAWVNVGLQSLPDEGFAGGGSVIGPDPRAVTQGAPVLTMPGGRLGGGGTTVNITVNGATDGPSVARQLRAILRGDENRTGQVIAL
jgi:hypothetical protein